MSTTSTQQSTTRQNRRRRAAAAVLVVAGLAGLGAASASQLDVSSADRVASGTSTPVVGLEDATATVTTVPAGDVAPDTTTGAVPVNLAITVDDGFGKAGMVYVNGGTGVPFTVAADASTPATVTVPGLDSHTELSSVGVVITG